MSGIAATGQAKQRTAGGLRRLAGKIDESHPEMPDIGGHLRDGARELQRGNLDGAKRHLDAAVHGLTPLQLHRHGVMTDEGHQMGKVHMTAIHRHRLNIQDIQDTMARNNQLRERKAAGQLPPAHPANTPVGQLPPGQLPKGPLGAAKRPDPAVTDEELASIAGAAIELSARTAMLERTPAPLGKPGGPGLYHVKGLGHSAYFQQVRNGLMKRGMDEAKASQMTWGILRRWARGGGNVHPEVQAAAAKAIAEEEAKAKMAHSHTAGRPGRVIELFNPAEPRGPHGEWVSMGRVAAHAFRYKGGQGGIGHVAAIHKLADYYNPPDTLQIPGGHGQPNEMLATALHHAADALSRRQMDSAQRHLDSAAFAARKINPQAQVHVEAVRRSLAGVPAGVSNRSNPRNRPTTFNPPRNTSGISFSWDGVLGAIELASQPSGQGNARSQNAENEPRVPKGQPGGGEFGSSGKKQGSPVRHPGPGSKEARARRKAQLLSQSHQLMQKARQLRTELRALEAEQRKASKSRGQATKAGQTGKSKASTPAKKQQATKTGKSAAGKGGSSKTSAASIHGRIIALRGQIAQLVGRAQELQSQAAKL